MGGGVTEIGHAPPHDKASQGAGDKGDAQARQNRADEEIVQHQCAPAWW